MGKLTDKIFGTPEERRIRSEREHQIKKKEQEAYWKGYEQQRMAEARAKGRRKGKSGSGIIGTFGKYATSFSQASEELMLGPRPPKKPKTSRTVVVKVVAGGGAKKVSRRRKPARKKNPYLLDY